MKVYIVIFAALFFVAQVYCAMDEEDSSEQDSSSVEEVKGRPEAKSGYESSGYGYEQQRPQVFFGGQYGGRCDQDGFYFNDDNSFITCNHGIAYVQQCAPGTRNGAAGSYRAGGYYTHTAFCDVNLVDFGYAAFHSQRGGFGQSSGGYGQSSGGYGQSSGGYGQSSGGQGKSNGGYGQMSSGHGQMSNGHGQSSGGYGQMSKGQGQSSGGYSKPKQSGYGQSQSSYQPKSYNSGYGSSSRYGGTGGSSSGGYASRSGGNGGYQAQQRNSYKPTYQIYTYRPSYQSYQPKQSNSNSGGGYKQQNQGHSSYGRKYTGYYSQRRYH